MSDTLKAVGAVTGYYAVVAVVVLTLGLLVPVAWSTQLGDVLASSALLVVAAVAVNWAVVKRGWAHWEQLGWPQWGRSVRGFGYGLGIGVVMAAGAVLLAVGPGGSRLELVREPAAAYVAALLEIGFLLGIAALAEELLFRGYPLARLARGIGKVRASVVLAVLFSLAHAANPNLSLLGLVNIGLAALVLSAVFFGSGALPAAWGVHVGWNGGLSLGADAPVSGVTFGVPIFEFTAGGPAWLTGGGFGPEGGMVATVVMLLVLALVVQMNRNRQEAGGS